MSDTEEYKDALFSEIVNELIIFIDTIIDTSDKARKPTILSVTKSTCTLLGYSENELIGRPLIDIFVDSKDVAKLLNESICCGKASKEEKKLKRKDGKELSVLFSYSAKYDKDNSVSGMLLIGQDITDRKKAEETVQYQANLFQSILDNMADGVALADEKGRLMLFNPAAERILGLGLVKTEPENLTSQYGLFMPDMKTPLPTEYLPLIRAARGEIVDQCELYVRTKKKSEGIFIHVNARPIKDDKGKVKGAVAVFNDITESKKAQDSLRESEERFRSLIDASFEGIVIYDKGEIIDANNSAAKYFGYSIAELKGMNILDLVADDCKKDIRKKLSQIKDDPEVDFGTFETTCVRKNGPRFFVEVYGKGIGFQGRRVRVIALRDISERKHVEQALKYRMDFENIMMNISAGFIDLEPDEIDEGIQSALQKIGEFAGVDRSYIALFSDDGRTIFAKSEWCADGVDSMRSQLKSTEISKFPYFHKKLRQKKQIYFPRVRDMPDEAKIEKKWLQKGGIRSIVVVPLIHGKSLKGFLGFDAVREEKEWSNDIIALLKITGEIFMRVLEHKYILEQLQKANEALEQKVDERTRELKEKHVQLVNSEKMAALGQLVAGVAHEINTPLGALKSNNDVFIRSIAKIQNVVSDLENDEHQHEYSMLNKMFENIDQLNEINKTAANRITTIVNSLRKFARLDQAEKDTVDIHEGLESTLTLVHHEFKNRITVHKEYSDLPLISCYPNQINQVFMNILVNAGQAIEGEGEVYIRTYVHGGFAVIEVQDTGKGISDADLKKIFSPGYTTKGVGVGTGLGLSIVYQIIKDHSGEIDVGSEVGKGTVIRISLPINDPAKHN